MSTARKCDLCGTYFDDEIYPRILVFKEYDPTRMNSDGTYYDLCASCYRDLQKWIKNQRPIGGDE